MHILVCGDLLFRVYLCFYTKLNDINQDLGKKIQPFTIAVCRNLGKLFVCKIEKFYSCVLYFISAYFNCICAMEFEVAINVIVEGHHIIGVILQNLHKKCL